MKQAQEYLRDLVRLFAGQSFTDDSGNVVTPSPLPVSTSGTVPDVTTTGTIAGNTSVTQALSGQASVTVQILTAGLTGTLNFEASDDGGTTYFPTALWPVGSTSTGNLVTAVVNPAANLLYEGNVSADSHFRVRGSGVSGGTATITIRAGLSTSSVVLDGPIPAGANLIGATRLQDGIISGQNATVAALHAADNQQPGGTAYGLLTGGVAQLLNAAGNLDRQRETGQDGIPSQGIATGTAQLAEPFSTTSATVVSAPFTAGKVITPAAMSGTNRGAAWSIQVGSVLVVDAGVNAEAVVVTAVTGTTFTAIFAKAHSGTWNITGFVFNQARDATVADGSTGAGFAAGATYLLNAALNAGSGGWEGERSAAGELDGASGAGTAVAAEYEFNSGGPALASGLPSGLGFDRGRNIQGKGQATGTITATVAGNTSVVFGSAAATNTIVPGTPLYLAVGAGAVVEVVYVTAAWVSGSSATVPLQSPVVNAGSTQARWDVYAAAGPGLNPILPSGIEVAEDVVWSPNATPPAFFLERAADGDAMPVNGIVAECDALVNGAGTFDRPRAVSGDAMANIGIEAAADMLWNGASWDRMRSATGDALPTTGIEAANDMLWNGTAFDRARSVSGDAMAQTGIEAASDLLWNGATYDRARSVSGDGMAATGIEAAASMLWNGATFDRWKGTGGVAQVSQTRSAATVFLQASSAQPGGNSGALVVGSYGELSVDVNVTAFTGGTAPAITFFVDRQGADGIWYQIYAGANITAAGTQSASLGAGLAATPVSFGGTVRLRWTLGGTVAPTSVTFSASIIGK